MMNNIYFLVTERTEINGIYEHRVEDVDENSNRRIHIKVNNPKIVDPGIMYNFLIDIAKVHEHVLKRIKELKKY